MPHPKSSTRARYALSVLRIAKEAPPAEAKRLVAALASEFPHTDTPADIIEAEVGAIASFKRLATALLEEDQRKMQYWTAASDAASSWARAAGED